MNRFLCDKFIKAQISTGTYWKHVFIIFSKYRMPKIRSIFFKFFIWCPIWIPNDQLIDRLQNTGIIYINNVKNREIKYMNMDNYQSLFVEVAYQYLISIESIAEL